MKIVNKARFELPEWFSDVAARLCEQASISPDLITITVKPRNSIRNKRWFFKRLTKRKQKRVQKHLNAPSGVARFDKQNIIIRMTARSLPEDIKFVLAHEIGHIKDMRVGNKPSQQSATRFALACNCYPVYKYGGIKRIRG